MKFRVVHQPTANPARSSYRIVEQTKGREVDWINRYLDHECLRRVADLTLRSYAQHLLHFLRWWESVHHTDVITQDALTESTLLDYVRFQSGQQPELLRIHDQSTRRRRRSRLARPLPWRSPSDCSRASGKLLAARAHGSRQTASRSESPAGERAQADHRATVRRRGGAILVQFPDLARPGHRGLDALAGPAIPGSEGSEPRGSALAGSPDPRARQGQQAPPSTPGSRSRPTARSLSAAGAARHPSTAASVCLSQRSRTRSCA